MSGDASGRQASRPSSAVKGAHDLLIVGIAGSLRRHSFNRGLIRAAAEGPPPGIQVRPFDLSDIPMYSQDVEDAGEPVPVRDLKAALLEADGLLVATPEYNHGVPGMLKNAIDWASRPKASTPLHDLPVAITGASPGQGSTARAQAQLRDIFAFMGACVMPLPELLVGQAAGRFDRQGNLVDPQVEVELRVLVKALGEWTRRLERQSAA